MRNFYSYKNYLACLLLFFCSNIHAQQTVGLFTHTSGSDDDGYVLVPPMLGSDTTYLIDKCGRLVHKWAGNYTEGLDAYLLPNGSLLRAGYYPDPVFDWETGSCGGIIQQYSWDGALQWQYICADSLQTQNHDIYPEPNGNILVAIWEVISDSLAIANGRNPSTVNSNLGLWFPKIEEITPVGTDSATVVWQWRLLDHLIQDYDSTKLNYGVVANHPELLDINYINLAATDSATNPDWLHLNQVTYNPTLNQVMVSFHNNDEIYILDHSTTTATAATHSGGTQNMGGDFLYRWGNPAVYGRGTTNKLFQQHDPTWITTGKYINQIMVFNNGLGRGAFPAANYSSVDIINPPIDSAGNYYIAPGMPYGPDSLSWTYSALPATSFYSAYMGGTQPLDNGNTLICQAIAGRLFEIDSNGDIVWDYVSPVNNGRVVSQGTTVDSADVYRCTFYPSSYSGFAGETLTPGLPIELNPLPSTCVLLNVPSLSVNNTIKIYPNPASNLVNIESDNLVSVAIMDITGRTMVSEKYSNTTSEQLNITSLSDGVYIICINGLQYKKIVVQH